MAEAGAQDHGPGPGPAVQPAQAAGSGHRAGAGAERNGGGARPGREDTGTGEPGGRPEPQDETQHLAAVLKLYRAIN